MPRPVSVAVTLVVLLFSSGLRYRWPKAVSLGETYRLVRLVTGVYSFVKPHRATQKLDWSQSDSPSEAPHPARQFGPAGESPHPVVGQIGTLN